MRSSRVRTSVLVAGVVVGYLAIALAWSATVAPFRGSDEHDHAFRADAVAHGSVLPDRGRREGTRGDLLPVRRSLVEAARPVCKVLVYVSPEDCQGWRGSSDQEILIPSGAARYNPSYYLVAGLASRPFEGVQALAAMRIVSALLSAALVGLAFMVATVGARTSWPATALMLTMTPAATFAAGLATPNGVHLAAIALHWASALRLRDVLGRGEAPRLLPWVGLAVGGVAAVYTHSLGVLWVGTILLICVVSAERPRAVVAQGFRTAPRLLSVSAALMVVAGVGWAMTVGTNDPRVEAKSFDGPVFPAVLVQPVLWFLQSFVTTSGNWWLGSGWVYLLGLVAVVGLLVVALPRCSRHERRALTLTTVLWIVVPTCLTLATLPQMGFAWQGRYSLPIGFGIIFLGTQALDRSDRDRRVAVLAVAALLASLMTVGAQAFWHDDKLSAESFVNRAGLNQWGQVLVAAVAMTGFALIAVSSWLMSSAPRPTARSMDGRQADIVRTDYSRQSFGSDCRLAPRRDAVDS